MKKLNLLLLALIFFSCKSAHKKIVAPPKKTPVINNQDRTNTIPDGAGDETNAGNEQTTTNLDPKTEPTPRAPLSPDLLSKTDCEKNFPFFWDAHNPGSCIYKSFSQLCADRTKASEDIRHTLSVLINKFGQSGTMSCANVANWLNSLTSLDLSQSEIVDLTPLNKLRLTELKLNNNKIVNINPLSTITSLQSLMLSNNGITDADTLKSLPALTNLDISHNPLTTVYPLSQIKTLISLFLSYTTSNSIESLATLPQLNILALNGLTLTNIDFIRKMPTLTRLYLADNKIFSLVDSQSPEINIFQLAYNLRYLDLSNNLLKKIDGLQTLIGLQTLLVQNNNLTGISIINNFSQLKVLNISNNPIDHINALDNLSQLTELHADDLTISSYFFLINMPAIRILSIKNCQITDSSKYAVLGQLPHLENLNVSGCKTRVDVNSVFPKGEPLIFVNAF